MKNKSTRNFNLTPNNTDEFFNKIFLKALYQGKIRDMDDKLVFDTQTDSVSIDKAAFKMLIGPSLSGIYNSELLVRANKNTFAAEDVIDICMWLNPALINLDLKEPKEFEKKFKEMFDSKNPNFDSSRLTIFKYQLHNILFDLDPERRKEVLDRLIPYGIINENELVNFGYYTYASEYQILDWYKEGKFSEKDLYTIGEQKGVKYKLVESRNGKQKMGATKIRAYMSFFPKDERIDMALFDEIPYSYLEYADIKKEDLFLTKYETFIAIMESRDKFPEKLQITSDDILAQYGKTINGNKIYKLILYGYVDSNKVIDIADSNKVLRIADVPEEDLFSEEEIIAYYTSDVLANMYFNGEVTLDFVSKYKKLLDEKSFEKKSENVIEFIKNKIMLDDEIQSEEKDNRVQKSLLETYDIGLCTSNVLKSNLSTKYLEEQYLEGNISEQELLNLYNDGVINGDIIKSYFSDKDVFDLYLSGELDYSVIALASNKEEMKNYVLEAAYDEKIPVTDIVKLYFESIISADDLEEISELYSEEFSITSYIDGNVSFDKIKELFEKRIIDYSSVTDLRDNGIITDKQLKELEQTIDKKEFFEELSRGNTYSLVTTRKGASRAPVKEPVDRTDKKDDKDKYEKERLLISTMFGISVDNLSEFATIESHKEDGRATSLNGYKVLGSEETGLVVFSKFKKENAVFVMPFYQAAYFLKAKESRADDIIVEDRMRDKSYLKTLSQVKVIVHTKHFAKNFADAACTLSPKVAEKMQDTSYASDVTYLVEEMRKEYKPAKEGREDK